MNLLTVHAIAFTPVHEALTNCLSRAHNNLSVAKVFGQLKKVEDSGYPFVTLTIEHAEGGSYDYSLNLEEVKNVDIGILNSWISSEVAFNFSTDTYNALLDIYRNGHSILYEEEEEFTEDIPVVEGILSGAEFETTGDLPGEIYIKTEEEITYIFPFFIDSAIVAVNGKKVIAFFEVRTINYITSIRLSE